MKSYLLGKDVSNPATRRTMNRLIAENAYFRMTGVAMTAITDNSTGVAANGWKEVPLQRDPFTHVNAATDLALQSDFYVVADKANNGIAVLKTALNALISKQEGIDQLAGGNGTVVTPGTIPAAEKIVDGTAAATALAISRAEGNATLKVIASNLSTLLLSYNRLQDLFGRPRQMDYGNQSAYQGSLLANLPAAGTPLTNTGDNMSKAAADAAFAVIVDNIAKLGALIQALQTQIDTRV